MELIQRVKHRCIDVVDILYANKGFTLRINNINQTTGIYLTKLKKKTQLFLEAFRRMHLQKTSWYANA